MQTDRPPVTTRTRGSCPRQYPACPPCIAFLTAASAICKFCCTLTVIGRDTGFHCPLILGLLYSYSTPTTPTTPTTPHHTTPHHTTLHNLPRNFTLLPTVLLLERWHWASCFSFVFVALNYSKFCPSLLKDSCDMPSTP